MQMTGSFQERVAQHTPCSYISGASSYKCLALLTLTSAGYLDRMNAHLLSELEPTLSFPNCTRCI